MKHNTPPQSRKTVHLTKATATRKAKREEGNQNIKKEGESAASVRNVSNNTTVTNNQKTKRRGGRGKKV